MQESGRPQTPGAQVPYTLAFYQLQKRDEKGAVKTLEP